ncbi:unnamed protein product [Linum trigynum]|uniref:Uncharacterized protein n=1 Tax=Linum trigynum TaxID=586398 RepID=A0AAV2C8M7_9ROSI
MTLSLPQSQPLTSISERNDEFDDGGDERSNSAEMALPRLSYARFPDLSAGGRTRRRLGKQRRAIKVSEVRTQASP